MPGGVQKRGNTKGGEMLKTTDIKKIVFKLYMIIWFILIWVYESPVGLH